MSDNNESVPVDSETEPSGSGGDSSSWESLDEEDNNNVAQKFSQTSVVLEKVFGHVGVQDLLRCRQICRPWNEAALIQSNLGSKVRVVLRKDNIDGFNRTCEKSFSLFCRRFTVQDVDLSSESALVFQQRFGESLTSLTLDNCTVSSPEGGLKLLTSPTLKELKIYGPLRQMSVCVDAEGIVSQLLPSLVSLDLHSPRFCHDGVGCFTTQHFLCTLLQHCSTLQGIHISGAADLWNNFVAVAKHLQTEKKNLNLQISDLKLSRIETPLKIQDFGFLLPRNRLLTLTLHDCSILAQFLDDLLLNFARYLKKLTILGAQSDSLMKSFTKIKEPGACAIEYLTLPLDGLVKGTDISNVLKVFPKLKQFDAVGTAIRATFSFCRQQVTSLRICEKVPLNPLGSGDASMATRNNYFMAGLSSPEDEQREFLKVLSVSEMCPKELVINLPSLNSKCLRRVFQQYSDLKELTVHNNSRNCLNAWTGIPVPMCRRISACKSFAVASSSCFLRLASVASLKELRRLEIGIKDEPPKAEFTLLYIIYGLTQLKKLEELVLNNFTISEVAAVELYKAIPGLHLVVNVSDPSWLEFRNSSQLDTFKTFLTCPPPPEEDTEEEDPISTALQDPKVVHKILSYLPHRSCFDLRLTSKLWHSCVNGHLHSDCLVEEDKATEANRYLFDPQDSNDTNHHHHSSPTSSPRRTTTQSQSQVVGASFLQGANNNAYELLNCVQNTKSITKLVIRGISRSSLNIYQRMTFRQHESRMKSASCEDRRKILYWFYPDGQDYFVLPTEGSNPEPSTVVLIGNWGKKDTGLLEFLDKASFVTSIVLHGLLYEVHDLILPKIATMRDLESLTILPYSAGSMTEINRNHLQILSNSSFALRTLVMQKLQVLTDNVSDLVQAHRYTLETIDVQNHVNVSDRLNFSIPNLKVLRLDEPPGVLLWTTLLANSSIEELHFERSGYVFNQLKSKAIPLSSDHGSSEDFYAKDLLCDVSLFLGSPYQTGGGPMKSTLQEGSDAALRFFDRFSYMTSLTIRGAHGHYGMLQGIFRNLTQLERLVFINTAGITDDILVGIPKYVLDGIDLFNPKRMQPELDGVDLGLVSIRNMTKLKYLNLDDQTACTDLSIIYGICHLKGLERFSCKKWKITDVALRALGDSTNIKNLDVEGCTSVSRLGLQYFNSKARNRLSS